MSSEVAVREEIKVLSAIGAECIIVTGWQRGPVPGNRPPVLVFPVDRLTVVRDAFAAHGMRAEAAVLESGVIDASRDPDFGRPRTSPDNFLIFMSGAMAGGGIAAMKFLARDVFGFATANSPQVSDGIWTITYDCFKEAIGQYCLAHAAGSRPEVQRRAKQITSGAGQSRTASR